MKKPVVLVNPPYSFWSPEKNYLRPFIGTMPSLGILTLAGFLRQKGYRVDVVESASWGLSEAQTIDRIVAADPACVGLTCTTASVLPASRIARGVKEKRPGTVILAGGPHVTALPQETFRRFPEFDYGIQGEGEPALADLLQALEAGEIPERVESAVFRRGEEVRVNPRRRFVENLDDLPLPAYDLLPSFPRAYRPPFLNSPRGPCASLITSRGCPQACTFCDRSVFGNRYRAYSEEYLLEWIARLYRRYGVRHLIFTDDQFAASRPRVLRFCAELSRRGLRVRWNCDARVDSVDPELLKEMKRAGCWMISYGIESGSQEILDGIRKGITPGQAEQALRWTRDAGVRAKGLFMIGYPEETGETLARTLSFIRRCPLDEINVSFVTPYPGTDLYRQLKGSPDFEEDWERMNALNCLLKPAALSLESLEKAYSRLIRGFYLRPGVTFSYLGVLLRSPENAARLAAGLGRCLVRR